ncbi:FtsX-like permease family protein [Mycetocola zhujimingii]|uniref:Permease n=1 Tax=Mycetocola zhujimingii TaxID=2079792 RepID=A0A2U1TB85_9MICO|nr:FtsX-like permease family protein [Mycetocola zhujimingii]PWC06149.1 permease [Mycetocola zhujimingii]
MTATTAFSPPTASASRSSGRAPIARLTWLLARPSAQSAAVLVLPGIAFAVTTALMLIVLGGGLMFSRWTLADNADAAVYQMLSVLALVLLLVPLASLGGAAARLSARRRDDRLATLRLLGATPGVVTQMTVLESTAIAVLGSVAGIVLYLVAMPFVGLIPFGGAAIGAGELWVGPGVLALVVVAVAALAAISAAIGLRQVTISPLGVRTRQSAPKMHWMRLVIGVVAILVAYLLLSSMAGIADMALTILVLGTGIGIGIGVLNLIGPWALGIAAKLSLRRAKTAAQLIAARGILESPKAAWRQVSGVAMTSFIAVVAGTGVAFVNTLTGDYDDATMLLLADVRTGIIITVVMSFLMVACSVGVNQAATVLDRRDLYVSLDRLGMPREVIESSRSRTVMGPLRFVAFGSALIGAVLVLPLVGITIVIAPASLLVIAGCLIGGVLLVWLSLKATSPVLTRVLSQPERL